MFCPNCRTRDVQDKWLVGQIIVGQVDKAPGLCTGGDNKMIVYVQVRIKNDSLCTGGDNKLIVYVLEVIIKC